MDHISNISKNVCRVPQVVNPRPRIRPVQPAIKVSPVAKRRVRRVAFKQADIARALAAVTKGGLIPGSVEVTPDGTIRIYSAGAEPAASLFDKWSDKL